MLQMAEAEAAALGLPTLLPHIFPHRQPILQMGEEEESRDYNPPLVSHLEVLPSTCHFDLSSDGSVLQSPSATAQAFISTGDVRCLKYLHDLHKKFPNGSVPAKYPVDGELIRLCMVDHIQGLGLTQYFSQEIQEILAQLYSNKQKKKTNDLPALKLFKDALAFRLLRMHGQHVNPGSLCWFLQDPELVKYMEENSEHFISAMYSVFRATDFQFPREYELEEARTFALKLLHNSKNRNRDHNFFISKGFQNMIKYELSAPWLARMDHLYHRKWIEENKSSPLWIGKASFYRMTCLDNNKLMQLAVENFEFQQAIYRQELEELKGWSKKWRLSEVGFGREKTVYLYFAMASSSCLPHNSIKRLVIAKAAIIVTVADDFYDMEGSLDELEILTDAVNRWDGEGLEGHGKTIFDALDDFVREVAAKCESKQGSNSVKKLQEMWGETFRSWMVARRWSLTGYIPSMDEYLATGMTSIAAHTMFLPATTSFFNQDSLPLQYHNITKLMMSIARLANDLQSYQKEEVDGKMNLVLLHLRENPNLSIEDSIKYVEQMLDVKKKEFLEHVFMDKGDMPKSCKKIHLCCTKVFQMFFNSANLFDNDTALLDDINKSIFLPLKPKPEPLLNPLPATTALEMKKISGIVPNISSQFRPILNHRGSTTFVVKQPCIKNPYVALVQDKYFCVPPMKYQLSFI